MTKDNPTSSIAICSAYLSLVLKKPVHNNELMVREMTANGEILRTGLLQTLNCKDLKNI